MLTVGLTGGYASGKSFIAAELVRLGATLIRADDLGRAAIEPDGPAYADVVREFGPAVLLPDGTVDRRKLASIVFPDAQRLKQLNAIIHPHVFRQEQELIHGFALQAAANHIRPAIVVVEAAIMIEVGSWRNYDKLIVATCPPAVQIARAQQRDHATEQEVRARLNRQMPLEEKARMADYLIDTSGTKEQTLAQTRKIWKELCSLEAERAARRNLESERGAKPLPAAVSTTKA